MDKIQSKDMSPICPNIASILMDLQNKSILKYSKQIFKGRNNKISRRSMTNIFLYIRINLLTNILLLFLIRAGRLIMWVKKAKARMASEIRI